VIDLWLRYLKKNGIGGVGMRAEVFEWVEPGSVGEELAGLGERMQAAAEKAAGGEIVEEAERLKEGLEAKVEPGMDEMEAKGGEKVEAGDQQIETEGKEAKTTANVGSGVETAVEGSRAD
jgi:small subunit ribosomal protein S10